MCLAGLSYRLWKTHKIVGFLGAYSCCAYFFVLTWTCGGILIIVL